MMRAQSRRRSVLRVEELERRDAPATLISATKFTYRDRDADFVTVTLSKPLLNAGNANFILGFDLGGVDGDNSLAQQLCLIDVAAFGKAAAGLSISAVATPSKAGGDGLVNVGYVNAFGID